MNESKNNLFKNGAIFFDLETTGLDIAKERIVSIAVVKIDPLGIKTEKEVLVNPTIPIPKEASDVHGITDDMIKDKPTFKQIAKSFYEYIEGFDLYGYNIVHYDLPLLVEELLRAGVEFDFSKIKIVDVMKIYKKLQPRDLSSFYNYYTGKVLQNSHNALADTSATYDGFLEMMEQESELNSCEVDKLQEMSGVSDKQVDFAGKFIRNDANIICYNFGGSKGQTVSSNMKFLDWMLSKDFSQDTKNWAMKLKKGEVI